jgi:hypothetical protein
MTTSAPECPALRRSLTGNDTTPGVPRRVTGAAVEDRSMDRSHAQRHNSMRSMYHNGNTVSFSSTPRGTTRVNTASPVNREGEQITNSCFQSFRLQCMTSRSVKPRSMRGARFGIVRSGIGFDRPVSCASSTYRDRFRYRRSVSTFGLGISVDGSVWEPLWILQLTDSMRFLFV